MDLEPFYPVPLELKSQLAGLETHLESKIDAVCKHVLARLRQGKGEGEGTQKGKRFMCLDCAEYKN
jgi:hypothetical protein